MEVDSMHSCIEKVLKRTKINLPADYVEVCRNSRTNPFPYEVEYFTHGFFKSFTPLQYFNSIRPGRSVGDPTGMDIKALRYERGTLTYKLQQSSISWEELPRRVKCSIVADVKSYKDLPPLYSSRRKIKKENTSI